MALRFPTQRLRALPSSRIDETLIIVAPSGTITASGRITRTTNTSQIRQVTSPLPRVRPASIAREQFLNKKLLWLTAIRATGLQELVYESMGRPLLDKAIEGSVIPACPCCFLHADSSALPLSPSVPEIH